MIGKQLAHFRILDKIGEGGMGVVYRAQDEKLGREVALKVLPSRYVADEERRARFLREARTAAAVTHPNIATVYEVDEAEGVTFLAMELVEGESLGARIGERPLQADEALRLAIEVAEGLSRAHRAGVIHRDLKPENIIIGSDGHAKILDFGLAKLHEDREGLVKDDTSRVKTISAEVTREGKILGTAAYMSPEQARGVAVDLRSDVFSFGIVLYEMVTGQPPFQGETTTDVLTAILRDPHPPVARFNPQVPAELERILARCLEKKPDDRYRDADEMLEELRRLKRITDSQPVPMVSESGIAARPSRFRFLPLVIAAVVIVVLALTVPLMLRGNGTPGSATPASTSHAGSLAVLPFANLQDTDDPQRMGQILQELLITDLSTLASLKVFSSQRLFDIQKQLGRDQRTTIDRDMASEVARRAGAHTMLTGSMSRLGDRWILTSQLVDVTGGMVLQSERIDGVDLYAMVDDLAARIRADLGIGDKGADPQVRDITSASLEAYQHYLSGVDHLNDLDFQEASEELQQALAIDPAFGRAYYKLAIAQWWHQGLDYYGPVTGPPPGEVLRTLLTGDFKIPDKDRGLAEAALSLVELRLPEARTRFEKLVEVYPDEKEAWYGLGEACFHGPHGGYTRETLEAFEQAMDLDPAFRLAYYHAIDIYSHEGRHDEGIRRVRPLLEREPHDPAWHVEMIRLAISKGDPGEIEAVVREARDTLDDGESLRIFLMGAADFYAHHGDTGKQEQYLQEALEVETETGNVRLYTQLGHLAVSQRQYRAAEQYLEEAMAANPRDGDTLKALFHLYESEGRLDEAVRRARSLVQSDPDFVTYYGFLVDAAIKQGDDREIAAALETMNALLARDSTSPNTGKRLLMQAAGTFYGTRNFTRAEEIGRRAMAVQSEVGNADLAGRFGWLYLDFGRYEEAAELLGASLKADPGNPAALSGMIGLYSRRGEHERAIDYADRFVETWPLAVDPRWIRLEAYLRGGRADAADGIFESELAHCETHKDRMTFLRMAGVAYLGVDQPGRAETILRQAVDLDPEGRDTRVRAELAWSLMRQDRLDEAEAILEQSLKTYPRDTGLRRVRSVLDLLQGDAAAAERRVRDLLATGPIHIDLYTLLVDTLAAQDRFAEAEPQARRIVAMSPDRPKLTLLAWILIDGDLDVGQGIEIARKVLEQPDDFNRAYRTFPFTPSAEHALGLGHMKQGRYEQAVRYLERAATLRPDRPSIQEHLRQARSHL